MNKIHVFISILCLACVFTVTVNAAQTARPKRAQVSINGSSITMDAYNIDGSNYFKLRDLANALANTDKRFDIYWNTAKSRVELTTGRAYADSASNIAQIPGNRAFVAMQQTMMLDNRQINVTTVNIDGLNYFKVRDFAAIMDIPITYDAATDVIALQVSAPKPTPTVTPVPTATPAYTAKDYGFGKIGDFSTKDMNGNKVTNSIFKEKPITFINLWATWCGPCRSELPDFQALYDKYNDKVKFVTIIDDGVSAKSKAIELINAYLTSFTNILPDPNIVEPMSSGYVPTSVIVDQGGNLILDKIIGVQNYNELIEKALKAVGNE